MVPLSQIPSGCTPPKSKREIQKEQRIDALQDLTKLLQLVTDQEKKYEEQLSPHSDFYQRHIIVQQFLQIQLKNRSRSTQRSLSLIVAHSFGRGYNTSRNIVQWENSWIDEREIPERKSREIYASWMDDKELKESIKNFARIQEDRMYYIYIKLLVQALTFLFRVEFLQARTIFERIRKFKRHF